MVSIAVLVALMGWSPEVSAGRKSKKGSSGGRSSSRSAPAAEPASLKLPDPPADLRNAGSPPASGGQANSGAPPTRGPARIDFDDRLIQGQTNKSGAVYLYDRKELQTKSMVKKRESFRQEILSTVYDTR